MTRQRLKNQNRVEFVDARDKFASDWPDFCTTPPVSRHLKHYWEALCKVTLGMSSNAPEAEFPTAFYFVEINIEEKIKSLLIKKGKELKARKIVLYKLTEMVNANDAREAKDAKEK